MEYLRQKLKEIAQIKDTPEAIALGFALGTFLAALPTPGFSIAVGIVTVAFWLRPSKLSMMVAFAIWNPLVLSPFYASSLSSAISRVLCSLASGFPLWQWES